MREQRPKPKPWREHCQNKSPRWAYPIRTSNWALEWVAWCLGGWVLLEVLEYCSTFSVLVAVILYFSESGARVQQRHYQAWQVINTAQGKGGNGGRIDAMQELNQDGVSLVGIQASDNAFLFGIQPQRCPTRSLRPGFFRYAPECLRPRQHDLLQSGFRQLSRSLARKRRSHRRRFK